MIVKNYLGVVRKRKLLCIKELMEICLALLIGALTCESMSAQKARRGDNLAELFRAAQQDTAAGRYEQAVKEYVQVLQIDPALIEARFNLALAYHSLGRYKLAIAELEKVVRARPTLAGANLFLGIDYLKEERCPEALIPLRKVLQAEPSNRDAQHALAACYVTTEQYAQAAEEYRDLASSDPDQADALYELGQNYLGLASNLADRMSQAEPDSAWARRLAGDLLAASARWIDAAVNYRKALAANPRQPGLHTSLGRIYLRQGELQMAAKEFRGGLRLDPENEDALLGLAEVELANGATKAALESISRIWETFPPYLGDQATFPSIGFTPAKADLLIDDLEASAADVPALHFLLRYLYQTAGKSAEARGQEALLQTMLSAWRNTHGGQRAWISKPCISHRYIACARELQAKPSRSATEGVELGKALMSLDDYIRAADVLADVLEQDKANLPAMYWLARSYMRLADGCFSELAERFPQSWRAYQFRGESDEVREDFDAAITEFQVAAHAHPNDAELWEGLGRVYFANKSFGRAEGALKHALELDPTLARAYYLLGCIDLDHHHEAQESLSYFQAALRYNPYLLEARAALGQAFLHLGEPERALPELEQAASIDRYGDIHYLLYVAYGRLGKSVLARRALARSEAIRKNSATSYQTRVAEAVEEENRK